MVVMDEVQRRPSGRPRDDTTGPALLDAARELVIRDGYRSVSIQQIVSRAGVSRQSLYRRWPSKADLVLDAFLQSAGEIPVGSGFDVGRKLNAFLLALFSNLEVDGPAIRSLIASAQDDPEFQVSFRERFVQPREQVITRMLESAKQAGEIKAEADIKIAAEALHGAFWYRLLQGDDLDVSFAKRLAGFILQGLRVESGV
jgi:AcrR family transcriptional regulator